MRLMNFAEGNNSQFDVAILIKSSSYEKIGLRNYYVNPLQDIGVSPAKVIASDLFYNDRNKCSKKEAKEHLAYIAPKLKVLGVKLILCADSHYFKELTKLPKSDPYLDQVVDCKLEGFEDFKCVYTLNYTSLMYNPAGQDKIDMSIRTVNGYLNGVSTKIQIPYTSRRFPFSVSDIKAELDDLHNYPELACDIETFGLKLGSGIGTIAFSESATAGVAFCCDYKPIEAEDGVFGIRKHNAKVRALLKQFFIDYQGELTFHNASFDIKQLIWELFMEHPLDLKGMFYGIEVLAKNFQDTRFMAFLCLNSTTRPELGLKALAYPYAGDYGVEEIKDITKVEITQLLSYNLDDTCSTFWVRDKYEPLMDLEQQREQYEFLRKTQRVMFKTELVGMPMDEDRLLEVERIIQDKRDDLLNKILESKYVFDAETILMEQEVVKYNSTHVKKRITIDDVQLEFNPNSGTQLTVLLYEVLELPVINRTDTKQPSTDADTLDALKEHTSDPEVKQLLMDISDYSKANQILNTFISAFKEGIMKADGRRYLHGNFNLAKVKSGRMSSSGPNLQNMPAKGEYGKLIKSIFVAPDGYLFVYADFNSLEDYISALLSKDPNKLKVYLGSDVYSVLIGDVEHILRDDCTITVNGVDHVLNDLAKELCANIDEKFKSDKQYDDLEAITIDAGNQPIDIQKIGRTSPYDGHSLRAAKYFKDELPNITTSVNSINSIKKNHKSKRDESKGPTFQMTYMGSAGGLVKQFGFPKSKANSIFENFHTLYSVTDDYIEDRLNEAAHLGYMTLAFGLKIRCPLLKQTIRGSRRAVKSVKGDERTLGNATGQSYGQLTPRAMIEVDEVAMATEFKYSVLPIAAIHDAGYYLIKNDYRTLKFINDTLIRAMQWQDDPAIWHDEVRIGAELDVCNESWADPCTIPNFASEAEIEEILLNHLEAA